MVGILKPMGIMVFYGDVNKFVSYRSCDQWKIQVFTVPRVIRMRVCCDFNQISSDKL